MDSFTLYCSGASCLGARSGNQDNLRLFEDVPWEDLTQDFEASLVTDTQQLRVFCVCDGVGGAARGEEASREALAAIDEYLQQTLSGPLPDILLDAAETAYHRVARFCQQERITSACTLAMVALRGREFATLNIGDSPIFLYDRRRPDPLLELSQRHNLAWEKRRAGREPEEGDASQLLNYLGKPYADVMDQSYRSWGTLAPNNILLLCSDGVGEAFSPEELTKYLKKGADAAWLCKRAAQAPYADNCTAICIKIKK